MSAVIIEGDCRTHLALIPEGTFDAAFCDPPYGDTSLKWDTICRGWIPALARVLKPNAGVWVFGSMRFLAPLFEEFESLGFRYSQDVVWEKQNGTGFHADRFRRVHEHAVMFYRGAWADVYHKTQRDGTFNTHGTLHRKNAPLHYGQSEANYEAEGGRERLTRSVLRVNNEHRRSIHPTQKPVELLLPLVRYSLPPGGLAVVPFAGSGSECLAVRQAGGRAIGYEIDPDMAAKANARLAA